MKVIIINDAKQVMSYRPQEDYEKSVQGDLYAYEYLGLEWMPTINKKGMVTELKRDEDKIAIKPPVPAGNEIEITEYRDNKDTYTESATPLFTMKIVLELPEGAIITDKPYVRGIDGYLYLAGDEPTEKPVEMQIEDLKAELAKIDAKYRTPRTLAEAMQDDEYALNKLAEADSLSEALRAELRELL